MTKTLYILGAGGHGKVVADAAIKMNQWKTVYFLDDQKVGQRILNILVKDSISKATKYKSNYAEFIVAIGDNSSRKRIQRHLELSNCQIATIIHPFSSIGTDVQIGRGTVIFAGVVINPSAVIGVGCILNTSCSVDHDSNLGDFVHLSPGGRISGAVTVAGESWIGTNSTLINNINIAGKCIIGAGGVVIKSINESGTYVGIPVRKIYMEDNIEERNLDI